MDSRLLDLICDYQDAVAAAVVLLERSGVDLPKSNVAWTAMDFPYGEVSPGVSMFKHGFGCAVHGPGLVVDFDFGVSGQTNGFDLGRLQAFASRRADIYRFSTLGEIRIAYEQAIALGEIRVDADHLSYLCRR